MALGDDVRQGPFAHPAGKKILQQFAGTLIGQELIVVQIDCCGPSAWTILHRGVDPFGKGRLVQVAAGAKLDFGLMLGHFKPPRGQIVHLSFLHAVGLMIGQRTVATLAFLHPVDLRVIGLFDHLERMSRMSGLPAGLPLPFLAQAFGRGFLKSIC
ncbi:hypothetical protein ES705_50715 [subsurface metagenome]